MPPTDGNRLIARVVAGAFFMELLDATIITTALPQMARTFHADAVNVGIGISAYLITLAVLIPASGWLTDRFGSRTVFGSAIAVFTIASALCGLSHTLLAFIAARVLQGAGGALMVPVGRLVVMRAAAKHDLVSTTAMITTPGLVATILGPPIGGFIVTYASWPWIFFINIPLGIVGFVLVLLFMPDERDASPPPFDLPGFLLSGTSLGTLMYGLDLLGRGESAPVSAAAIVAGTLLGALAVRHARRTAHPLLDLDLLKIPTFSTSIVWGGLAVRLVVGSTPFLWGLMFQVALGMSAFTAGLVIVVCALADVITKAFTTRAVRRFGLRSLLIVCCVLLGIGIALCALFTPRTPLIAIAAVLFAIGVVRSFAFTASSALAYADVPRERMSRATSLAMTSQQLSFGLGVAGAALILHLAAASRPALPVPYALGDFRIAFIAFGLLAIGGAFAFSRLEPSAGLSLSRRPATAPR